MLSRFRPYKLASIILIGALSFMADRAGHFSTWNEQIADTRMSLSRRSAEGQYVFVAVDPLSLAEIGTWPWSRAQHARLLDRLVDAGARDILFDFDFTFPSDAAGDAAFAAALERAGGATYLAVFAQNATAEDTAMRHYNVPLSAFARHAWPALVNVQTDARGLVRHYPFGAMIDGEYVLSAGALMANSYRPDIPSFEIDFSIRSETVPVVSTKDVLRGTLAPGAFDGRSVVVGASAVELTDQLTVPVQGVVAGPLLHVLAAETLSQGRAIRWVRVDWMAAGLTLALLLLSVGRTARPLTHLGGTALGLSLVEASALWLFRDAGIMAPTAMLYPGLFGYVIARLAQSLRASNWLLMKKTAEVRNTLRLLERVFDDGLDAVVILASDGAVLRHSASAAEIFGTDDKGALRLPDRLRHARPFPNSAPMQTLELRSANKTVLLEYRATETRVERPTSVGKPPRLELVRTLVLRDITQLHAQEKDIAYMSNYDDRTGALRRNAFLSFLGLHLERGQDTIVFALTLDRFKTVNVTLGRVVGDAILKEVVARFQRSSLLLSAPMRLGGTSFVVFTESTADLALAGEMAVDLRDEIGGAYRLKDANAQLSVRVGYATVRGRSATSAEVALERAVEAMDAAKTSGASIAAYDHSAWERQKRARGIERALESALGNGEFRLLYQPQHRVTDETLVGAEALIRWESPTMGAVNPDEFIGIAESTGFIVELGNWAIEQAARDTLTLPPDVVIAVNVSGTQIMRGQLLADTERILKRVGLSPDRLCFELTETVMLASSDDIVETMQDLSFLGITWALDDFGTGFSSMEYLSKMPLEKVKLDKSFIMALGDDPAARPILHSTSELCRGLGVKLLCEGVETREQLAVLIEEGCHEAQGYLFGTPRPIDELVQNAENRRLA